MMKFKDAPLWCRWFKERKCWQRGRRVRKGECTPCLLAFQLHTRVNTLNGKKIPIRR